MTNSMSRRGDKLKSESSTERYCWHIIDAAFEFGLASRPFSDDNKCKRSISFSLRDDLSLVD